MTNNFALSGTNSSSQTMGTTIIGNDDSSLNGSGHSLVLNTDLIISFFEHAKKTESKSLRPTVRTSFHGFNVAANGDLLYTKFDGDDLHITPADNIEQYIMYEIITDEFLVVPSSIS